MKAVYWQKGDSIDFENTTNNIIEANTVMVFGTKIGIVGTTVNPGNKSSLIVSGVWKMEKDDSDIEAGQKVFYSVSKEKITTEETTTVDSEEVNNIDVGYATAAAASTSNTVTVKILG